MRLAILTFVLPLAACSPSETQAPVASESAAPAVAQPAFEPTVVQRENGLKIELLAPGSGPTIAIDSRVTLHYAAYVPGNEKPFDDTREGGIPLELDLSGRHGPKPLAGLALGLVGLRRSAKAKLTIPAALAWGDAGGPGSSVPPQSDVVYSVEILEVR
jgi:FKBP-type peptidyl-prolyl cis-trans isomerase